MPPWRTVEDTREAGKPVSLTTMESASSAALRCCTSKSGGTYSASITGVSGSTLMKRIVPSDGAATSSAVATAGLAKSGSARSIGTRILLYMAPSLCELAFSDILPRPRANREWLAVGAPGCDGAGRAEMRAAARRFGANGASPTRSYPARMGQAPRALIQREWGKPHARGSHAVGFRQRARADETFEPAALRRQLAPSVA